MASRYRGEPSFPCERTTVKGLPCGRRCKWTRTCFLHGGKAPNTQRLVPIRRQLWRLGMPAEEARVWCGTPEKASAIGAQIIANLLDEGTAEQRLDAARMLLDYASR